MNLYLLMLGSLIVLLMHPTSTVANYQLDCISILKEPSKYPLDWINRCSDRRALSEDGEQHFCLEQKCHDKRCPFGWAKDDYGCETCSCKDEEVEGWNDGGDEIIDDEKWEGDIILTKKMKDFLSGELEGGGGVGVADGVSDAFSGLPLWTMYKRGSTYVVPFVIESSIGQTGRTAILAAAADISSYSCINLEPRSNQVKYLSFYRGSGCSSSVGAVSRIQRISLGFGCWYKGTVIHEILHSLGFWHEQSRPDRDSHVTLNEANVSPRHLYNFQKFTNAQVDSLGSAYDVSSVMHYNSYAFSINGRPTMTDKRGNALKTQRNGLSRSDIFQLNKLYTCSDYTGPATKVCKDTKILCGYWSRVGYCKENMGFYVYMKENCCKSCQYHRIKKVAQNTVPNVAQKCWDDNSNCNFWSKNGYCSSKRAYMSKNCCKSCKAVAMKCMDSNASCGAWAEKGYCRSSQYTKTNCRKSCNLC